MNVFESDGGDTSAHVGPGDEATGCGPLVYLVALEHPNADSAAEAAIKTAMRLKTAGRLKTAMQFISGRINPLEIEGTSYSYLSLTLVAPLASITSGLFKGVLT